MNKTFPNASAAKTTLKGTGKSWRKVNGKIVWPAEMKMFLVSRIKEHISVLEGNNSVDPQHKMRVWDQIYKALVRRGMPDSEVRTVKKVWSGLRASTIEAYRRMETKRRNTRTTVEISELQRAIHEVIELSNKLKASGNSVMPLPMKIKVEIEDEVDANMTENELPIVGDTSETSQLNQTQREQQHLQLRSNPVVVLRPLNIDNSSTELPIDSTEDVMEPEMPAPRIEPKNVSPPPAIPTPPPSMPTPPPSIENVSVIAHPPTGHASEHEIPPDCRRIYDQIAEAELKIKLLQQRKEEQSLEYERAIYIRRLDILDSDLKKRKIEIDLMVRSHQRDANANPRPLE